MVRQDSPQVAKKKTVSQKDVSLEEMLEAGCHFGHRSDRWNPKIAPYVFGIREGVHIFDLEKTREQLLIAISELRRRAAAGEVILLVGTKQQAQEIVRDTAQKLGIPYITERWIGGILTNFVQIKKRIERLALMKKEREAGEYKKFTKKEQLLLDREIAQLEKKFGGISSLGNTPGVLVIVDIRKERTAVAEARRVGIPIVGIVDTNSDPTLIDFPIPANDDATKSVEFIIKKLGEAIEEGQKTKAAKVEKVGKAEQVEQIVQAI